MEVDNARMFPHGFGRILVGQSVCTVVGIVLQPCAAMDGQDRGTLGPLLAQEIGIMPQAFAYGTGSVSCNSVFIRYLGRFLNQEELMEHEATVQNP